jgi:hypothetical protein
LLIHNAVPNCVAFLGRKLQGEDRVTATAFLLTAKERDLNFMYLVTAAHVIEHTKSSEYSDDGLIYLHLNAKAGGRVTVRTQIGDWFVHPTDSAIDVAVLPFGLTPELDHLAVEYEMGSEIDPEQWSISIGTDVFITGLFLRHFGRQRNIPIIRTGTIAALPGEPIDIGEPDEERSVRAYLIETHSIGGLSGSPVFANPIGISPSHGYPALQVMHIWIGVVASHWDFDIDRMNQEKINSGIAIVSPKESVMEVLQHPRLIEMRKNEFEKRSKRNAPTLDDSSGAPLQKTHAPKEEDRIDIPIPARAAVMDVFKKATQKREKKT